MGYSQRGEVIDREGEVIYRAAGFHDPPTAKERATQAQIASGSSFELVTGVIGAVIAVSGVAGYFPAYMAAIATIAIGLALIAQGGTLAARWQTGPHVASTARIEALGIGTEVIGGFAGIALGALALLGVAPSVLSPVAMIVVGAALLFGGPAEPQLAAAAPRARQPFRVARDSMRTASSVMVMGGLAGIVLGVLGLTLDRYTFVLANIAALCVAGALTVAGGAVTARFGRRFA
ncbi:MAG: hypothetical protein M4D80_24180 [Myxococcota bacterium]|nr:hypothetical protein [Myxococcota bacterium]